MESKLTHTLIDKNFKTTHKLNQTPINLCEEPGTQADIHEYQALAFYIHNDHKVINRVISLRLGHDIQP